jgi:hypothetical protein
VALGDPYISTGDLKERLALEDEIDDGLLAGAVAAASDGVTDYCGRDFQKSAAATARRYRPTHPTLVITTDFFTTTGLVVKIDQDYDGVFETTIPSTDYELEPLDGIVNGREGFPFWKVRLVYGVPYPCTRRASIQVTAQWGWVEVPDKVIEATLILAQDLYGLKDTRFGVGGFGEFGRIRARENPHVAMLVGNYRRNSVKVGG